MLLFTDDGAVHALMVFVVVAMPCVWTTVIVDGVHLAAERALVRTRLDADALVVAKAMRCILLVDGDETAVVKEGTSGCGVCVCVLWGRG